MEIINKLNDQKDDHLPTLLNMCLSSANLVTGCFNCGLKSVSNFANKIFKMADQYLTKNAAKQDAQLNRELINKTFEAFEKKKDAAKLISGRASTMA
jgi:hypothetical protein